MNDNLFMINLRYFMNFLVIFKNLFGMFLFNLFINIFIKFKDFFLMVRFNFCVDVNSFDFF